jgi:ribosomal protein L33
MQNLFKNLKNEKLSDSEKQIMFNRLNSFIEENPIQTVWYKNIGNKIVSPFQDGFLLHHKMLASAFVIVILVSATGGTSIVANSSVPGNLLYPVKINLNEKVETFTAISSEAKAVVEAKHINERLSEAEILSTQNKLNDIIKIQIETKFSQDLQNTMVRIDTLGTSGNTESAKKVKVDIEKSLQKHKEVVDEILKKKETKIVESSSDTKPEARIMKKANAPEPQIDPVPESRIMMFSASMTTEGTTSVATTSKNRTSETRKIEDKKYEKHEDKDTPLLNETLRRILESKERNED